MKNALMFTLFLFLSTVASLAQEAKESTSDTWYVWIDTTVKTGSETSRIVSKQPFEITCCVKSPKYRKLLKKAEKWIQKNVDENYQGESPLNKIQDANLAVTMMKEATEQNGQGTKLVMVDYQEKCN